MAAGGATQRNLGLVLAPVFDWSSEPSTTPLDDLPSLPLRDEIPPDNPPRIKLYVTDRLYPVIFLAEEKVSSSRMPSKEEIDSTSAKNCVTSESSTIPFAADELPAQSGDLAFTT